MPAHNSPGYGMAEHTDPAPQADPPPEHPITHRCSTCGTGLYAVPVGYSGTLSVWVNRARHRHDHDNGWYPVALIDAVPAAERTAHPDASVLAERLDTAAVEAWVLVAGAVDDDDHADGPIPWRIVVGTYEEAQGAADQANLAHLAEHGRVNPIDRITVHDHAVPVVTYP